jgi:hypothetical protein
LLSRARHACTDGSNVTAQHEWLNLAVSSGTTCDEFFAHGIPSLIRMPGTGVYERGLGLVSGWEAKIEAFASEQVLPRMKNKTAVGVFLGDEICCHNSSCWHDQLYPMSAKLRDLLGPKAMLYENECGDSIAGGGMAHGHPVGPPLDKIAPDLDFVSIDLYKGFLPTDDNGTAEAIAARAFVEKEVYPKLAPHQKIFVVPGTFACSNLTYMPLARSSHSVVEKLKAYFAWGKEDPRVAGINPWHYNYRGKPQHPPPCDMQLGAADMPDVVAELAVIGKWIKSQQSHAVSPIPVVSGSMEVQG